MNLFNKIFYIFALLKVVRHGDLEQANPRTHNILKAYSSSGQPCNSAYLMRFFIVFYETTQSAVAFLLYSNRDKGACKRCTSILSVVGSGQTGRHRSGENSKGLFAGAFSLFLLFFFSSCFRFFFSTFSLLNSVNLNSL